MARRVLIGPDTGASVRDVICLAFVEPVEHGLSQKAVEIGQVFGFPITNSMVVTWIVALGLILFAQLSTRRMTEIPGGAQNLHAEEPGRQVGRWKQLASQQCLLEG